MAGLFFSVSLVLRCPNVSPPRRKGDPHVYLYSSEVALDDSVMTVMVPVPVGTFYPDGTRAQVMGPADVVGDTIFMRPGPSVFPSDNAVYGRPFVFATAYVAAWAYGIFCATVQGGTRWPAPLDLMCSYDTQSDHLRRFEILPPDTPVVIAGNIINSEDGMLQIDVHDVSLRGEAPPCSANSLAGLPVRPGQRRALCHWLKTHYPFAEPARTVDAVDTAGTASCGESALPAAVPVQALCQVALLQSMSPAFTADDEAAFCRLLDDSAVILRAARHASPPVDARVATDTSDSGATPSADDPSASVRDSRASAAVTPTAIADVAIASTPDGAAVAIASTPDGAVTVASTPVAHQVPGRSLAEELAIREALEFAFACRDEGPIGQTPVDWGLADAAREPSPWDDSRQPSPWYDWRGAGPRDAGALPAREVIDLTADSSDDEGKVPVCKRIKVFAPGRVFSCTW